MKIVIALDGAKLSERSLSWLGPLAPLGIDAVSLIAVSEVFEEGVEIRHGEEFFDRECVLLGAYLRETAARLRETHGFSIETEVRIGRPDDEILKFAREKHADMLLISTHGRSGITRWSIGSVADKVLRHAEMPVFVLGPHASAAEPGPIARILVPLDGSPLAEESLAFSKEWAHKLRAKVHLVRVVSFPATYSEETVIYMPELMDSMREAATAYLEKVAPRLDGVDTVRAQLQGAAAVELMEYARKQGIDLAIMTSHARRGIARTVLGSTTDRMLQGPCPVLVLPVG